MSTLIIRVGMFGGKKALFYFSLDLTAYTSLGRESLIQIQFGIEKVLSCLNSRFHQVPTMF